MLSTIGRSDGWFGGYIENRCTPIENSIRNSLSSRDSAAFAAGPGADDSAVADCVNGSRSLDSHGGDRKDAAKIYCPSMSRDGPPHDPR